MRAFQKKRKLQKLKKDFEAFLRERASLVAIAVKKLAAGQQPSASDIYDSVTSQPAPVSV